MNEPRRTGSPIAVGGILLGLALLLSQLYSQEAEMRYQSSHVDQLEEQRQEMGGRPFLEFLRVPDMSAGLYVLEPDDVDRQNPHPQDEIYYVVSGKGILQVDEEDIAVEAGSMVYVKAKVPHRFHSIEEELKVLVVFAPALGSD